MQCCDESCFGASKFVCLFNLRKQVFANPDLNYQADQIFFYSMMFIVIGGGAAIAMLFQVILAICVNCCFLAISELYFSDTAFRKFHELHAIMGLW